jgi:hypothetical protein
LPRAAARAVSEKYVYKKNLTPILWATVKSEGDFAGDSIPGWVISPLILDPCHPGLNTNFYAQVGI